MESLYSTPFPCCTPQEKKSYEVIWKLNCFFFFLPFESFPTKSNLSIESKIMQDIRKMKLLERVSWRKYNWGLAVLWFSFWFPIWLWLGSWITDITWKENEILKLHSQYMKICYSQLLKLTCCILYPPVHSTWYFNILISFQLQCIHAKFKSKLFDATENTISHGAGT